MSAFDYRELRLQQIELGVASEILDESKSIGKFDVYIKQASLIDPLGEITSIKNALHQQTGLDRLENKGLIRVLNRDEVLKSGIHVQIKDITKFTSFYTELFESIPSVGTGARIVYSTRTGRGKINGKSFKLNRGSRNRKVFDYLVRRPKKYVTKERIWKIAGKKEKFIVDNNSTIEFNTIITTLREGLRNISPEHLRLKKSVILYAQVTLTE